VFTTRLRDTAFKRVLRRMPLGSAVKLEGPFGSVTLHNKVSRPAVLLAGGIGVTPFRSITRWAAQQRLPHRIALLYANRRPEDAPFLAELAGYAEENPNFVFVPTMSELEGSRVPWAGERGNIDQALLDRVVKPLAEVGPPVYYAAGPAGMVAVLRATLRQAGVDDDDLRTEEFSGY
ncbi:MAG: FAD-dependent oxidoreductase, partial [Deltaproteobacteria bacterium]|nr:FAD-dependent oxidoreductase [Deltaproteobacteria bacterium]